jgi:hypothetical protein
MRRDQDNALEALMEQLIESGTEEMASVFAGLFNLAIRIERERFLRAGHYERSSERRGYANGSKPKKLDTPAGTVRLQVPKTAGHEEPGPGARPALLPRRHAGGDRDVRQRRLKPQRRGGHKL